VTLCRPLSYGRRTAPSKEDGRTLEWGGDAYSALAQDYVVMSDQWDASPPSPSVLCGHPCHYDAIPGTTTPSPTLWGYGATRHRHVGCCALYGLPLAAPSISVRMTTQRKISTPPPSKPLLDGHRARHDAPPEARFVRTAIQFVALSAMPSHVARTVRHAYKLPPPWPIKGGAVPWPQGDDDER
jgi:hypothetical protein